MNRTFRLSDSDLLDPGVHVIEASAGTGKTYGVVGLLVRSFALSDELKPTQVVAVTFTRAATAELRDRVRAALTATLADLREGVTTSAPDVRPGSYVRELAEAESGEARDAVIRRLAVAVDGLDQIEISTIHGLCHQILRASAHLAGGAWVEREVVSLDERVQWYANDILARVDSMEDEALRSILRKAVEPEDGAFRKAVSTVMHDRSAPFGTAIPDESDALARAAEAVRALIDAIAAWPQGDMSRIKPADKLGAVCVGLKDASAALAAGRVPGRLGKLLAMLGDKNEGFLPTTPTGKSRLGAPALVSSYIAIREAASRCHVASLELRAAWLASARTTIRDDLVRSGQIDQQGLLEEAAAALDSPTSGEAVCAMLRERWRVAFVDEFQDTDRVQWRIFSRLFSGRADARLYLVGDPKQSIYRFRGADIDTYLDARAADGTQIRVMHTNWRSDGGLIDAMNRMAAGERYGTSSDAARAIDYIAVEARPRAPMSRLVGASGEAPHPPVIVRPVWKGARDGTRAVANRAKTERVVVDTLADDIRALLDASARGELLLDTGDGRRRLVAGDLAVLVRRKAGVTNVRAALARHGIPVATESRDSVFDTQEAREVGLFCALLAQPGDRGALRAWRMTRFAGHGTVSDRIGIVEGEPERYADQARIWRRTFERLGLIAAWRQMMEDCRALDHLVAYAAPLRVATNAQHIVELVAAKAREEGCGAESLPLLLQRLRDDEDGESDERLLRIETDDNAVRVMTSHVSKGLEFPVVFLPDAALGSTARDPLKASLPLLESRTVDDGSRERVCWVDARLLDESTREGLKHRIEAEEEAEDRRLYYVSMTRARHLLVTYQALSVSGKKAPKTLDDRAESGAGMFKDAIGSPTWRWMTTAAGLGPDWGMGISTLAEAVETFGAHLPGSGIGWAETCPWSTGGSADIERPEATFVHDASVRAVVDGAWRRSSFSSLARETAGGRPYEPGSGELIGAAALVDGRFAGDAEVRAGGDEPGTEASEGEGDPVDGEVATSVGMPSLPPGRDAGTLLHAVFERLDFTVGADEDARAGTAAIEAVIAGEAVRHNLLGSPSLQASLASEVREVLRAPLGGPLGTARLCDLALASRLNELRFELPVAGGTSPTGRLTVPAFAEALTSGGDDAMGGAYRARLLQLSFGEVAGFLTGIIDLVFVREVDGVRRWFVADYKSNRGNAMLPPEQRLDPGAIRREMEAHHYHVQYHLYLLALHRFLRGRLGDAYRYERDVGGVYYLFVRGMGVRGVSGVGGAAGVFHHRPALSVIDALDRLFEQGAR